MRKEKEETKDKYQWLDKDDERSMSDKEILEKYVYLEKSCLLESERKEIMDMFYKYKDAFSLRDKIGTFPNIEVEIDATDKSPFLYNHVMLKGRYSYFR